MRVLLGVAGGALVAATALASCSSFGGDTAPPEDGAVDAAQGPREAGDLADSRDDRGASGDAAARRFCAPDASDAGVYCLDFDDLSIGPAGAPRSFGPFATDPDGRDPDDRAEWDVIASVPEPSHAGRLRVVSPPDGGVSAASRAAMEIVLPGSRPTEIECTLSWRTVLRAPFSASSFPEHIALLTLLYVRPDTSEARLSLVTNTAGEAQIFQPTAPPGAQLTTLSDVEGPDWRRAKVRFVIPGDNQTSFLVVTNLLAMNPVPINVAYTLKDPVGPFRLLIGPDYVSTTPWEVHFDDVLCAVRL